MDGGEEIGHGTHARVIIDLAKFSEQLAIKFANKSG
jgi:predicted thioesterase